MRLPRRRRASRRRRRRRRRPPPPDTDCPYLDSLDDAHAACDAVDGCDAIEYNGDDGATCFKQCGGAYAFTAQTAPGTWLASIRAACTPPLAPPPSPGLPPAAPPPPAPPLLPRSEFYFRVFSGGCHANTGAAPYCVCSPNYDPTAVRAATAIRSNPTGGNYECTFSAPIGKEIIVHDWIAWSYNDPTNEHPFIEFNGQHVYVHDNVPDDDDDAWRYDDGPVEDHIQGDPPIIRATAT